MHPHANTRAHPAYIYERAHSSHIYTDFPHVPTDEHALTFAFTPPHTGTHMCTHSPMFTMPVHRHAHTEHQVYGTTPAVTVFTKEPLSFQIMGSL